MIAMFKDAFGARSEKVEVDLCAFLLVALYGLDLLTATPSAKPYRCLEKLRLVPMA